MKGKRTRRDRKQPKQARNPLDTAAGRVIPVMEACFQAISRARGNAPVEPEFSGCLPPWCHNIANQFAKTILKSMIALDPKGQFDARNVGRMIGFFLRSGVFFFKGLEPMLRKNGLWDLPMNEEAKIKGIFGLEVLFPIVTKKFNLPIKNENQLLHQIKRHGEKRAINLMESIKNLLVHLWGQSIEDQHRFLCGIPEGFTTFLDNEGQYTGDRGRTNLYIALLVFWPEIAELQKAEPPKSRRDLQRWLIDEKMVFMVNDDDWFDHFCDEIGLVMKGVGRKAKLEV